MSNKKEILTYESTVEKKLRNNLLELFKKCPLPEEQLLSNLGLFLNSKNLSRILFMDFMYKKIVDVQGIIIEFGVRWGQNLSLFTALRGIYEPYNRHRKIVGFDTFEGFPSIHEKDGNSEMMKKGQLDLTNDYELFLGKVLENQEKDNPLSHLKSLNLLRGMELNKFMNI